jgi:C-terminal processing protease CtpA/Prc
MEKPMKASSLLLMSVIANTAWAAAPASEAQLQSQIAAIQAEMQAAGHDISGLVRLQMWMDQHAGAAGKSWSGASLGIVVAYSGDDGVRVSALVHGSPAGQAGIRSGDTIILIGASPLAADPLMTPVEKYRASLDALKPGTLVTVEYLRAGAPGHTTVVVGVLDRTEVQAQLEAAQTVLGVDSPRLSELVGEDMALRSLPAARTTLGIVLDTTDAIPDGVRIAAVTPGGAASTAELRSGDVITAVDGQPLAWQDDSSPSTSFHRLTERAKPGDKLKLDYSRAGKAATTEIRVPPAGPEPPA